jgi:hypothetical protein
VVLYPAILDRLLYNTASEIIITLTSYLDLVCQANIIFRKLRLNYHLTSVKSNTQKPLVPLILFLSLLPVVSLIISNSRDTINLSATSNKIVWTSNQGGKKHPKIPIEKTIRCIYCYKNNLCFWYESPDHKIRNYPTKPDQLAKKKTISTIITVTENK